MHPRRQRPAPRSPSPAPNAPHPPGAATRASAEDALELLTEYRGRSVEEARARAAAALARDNLWAHARWRQAERLIRALGRSPPASHCH